MYNTRTMEFRLSLSRTRDILQRFCYSFYNCIYDMLERYCFGLFRHRETLESYVPVLDYLALSYNNNISIHETPEYRTTDASLSRRSLRGFFFFLSCQPREFFLYFSYGIPSDRQSAFRDFLCNISGYTLFSIFSASSSLIFFFRMLFCCRVFSDLFRIARDSIYRISLLLDVFCLQYCNCYI